MDGATPVCAALAGVADIRVVAQPGSIGGEILAHMDKAVDNLPVLPEIAQRVMDLVKSPESSARQLAAIISEDAVIALKILKVANSALYGGLTEIRDMTSACSRLGMKTISNIVQTVVNGNLYVTGNKQFRDMMRALWRHNVATAHCADEIAKMLAEPRSDELFIAGLIHDIGKVCLLEIISDAYSGNIGKLREAPELLQEVLENYHSLVGLSVIEHWGLSNEFSVTTYCHLDPATTPFEELTPMVHMVALASRIAHMSGFGFGTEDDTSLISHPSAAFLGLNDIRLATLRVDLLERLEPLLGALGESDGEAATP
jgi:HD-like signal output (HDOD) protein